jgi:catechol 2,3-dioxygenase-like lactoylglutathione lyase family enzyme
MISHVTVGTSDLSRAIAFYDAIFIPLGIHRFWTAANGQTAGWQRDEGSGRFYVTAPFNGQAPAPGNGWMCAFAAPNREAVDIAHAAGLAHGGRDEGAPGLRPQYAPDYYGAYLRDPDGNKLHVVHRGS